MDDVILELIVKETIKDIDLYETAEISDEIFLSYFEHNMKIFRYDDIDILTEAGWKEAWDAIKKIKITPGGQDKKIIFGKDSHTLDAAKATAKGTAKVASKGWDYIKSKIGNKQSIDNTTSTINNPNTATSKINNIKNTISASFAAKSKMANGVLRPSKSSMEGAKKLNFAGQSKLRFAT